MTTLRIGLGLFGCFCSFAYLKESVLGKRRCSSGQHAFKPHLHDLQWMQFRTTNLNILAPRHRQDHVCSKAYLSLPSQVLPSAPNTLPEQHDMGDTHIYTQADKHTLPQLLGARKPDHCYSSYALAGSLTQASRAQPLPGDRPAEK